MDIETILSSLEEEVRRRRGLAAIETEAVLRDADLQKAAALSAAAEIVGHFGQFGQFGAVGQRKRHRQNGTDSPK